MRRIDRKLKNSFKQPSKEILQVGTRLAARLVNCRTMRSYQRWLQDVSVIFGYEYSINLVRNRLEGKSSKQDGTLSIKENQVSLPELIHQSG